MKPKPLSSLNHLTVPVAMRAASMRCVRCERGDCLEQRRRARALNEPGARVAHLRMIGPRYQPNGRDSPVGRAPAAMLGGAVDVVAREAARLSPAQTRFFGS